MTPNHALQRTTPKRHAGGYPYTPAATRRHRAAIARSLSLGPLGGVTAALGVGAFWSCGLLAARW